MSLIHTCELNEANPLDYLTELQRHARELEADPSAWDALETIARRWPGSATPARRRSRMNPALARKDKLYAAMRERILGNGAQTGL